MVMILRHTSNVWLLPGGWSFLVRMAKLKYEERLAIVTAAVYDINDLVIR